MTEFTEGALANVQRLLVLTGSDKSRILQMTIWLNDMKHWAEMTAVHEKWIPRAGSPQYRRCTRPELRRKIMLTAAQRADAPLLMTIDTAIAPDGPEISMKTLELNQANWDKPDNGNCNVGLLLPSSNCCQRRSRQPFPPLSGASF
ncbi:Rid family hydrolase [Rhizobium mongolense]|uniref:Rid family hydrolase n=1 Tax=Rhizobium mongolense TaxID=57676 RepID=UPI0034A5BFC0